MKENPKFWVVHRKIKEGKSSNGDTSSDDLGAARDFPNLQGFLSFLVLSMGQEVKVNLSNGIQMTKKKI